MLIKNFLDQKQKMLNEEFSHMNDMQRKAIFKVKGPVLILAGAGSGKTTVLVNRILYLLKHGNSYYSEKGFDEFKELYETNQLEKINWDEKFLKVDIPYPEQILAITFTNKAAKELCLRLEDALGEKARRINSGTFHSQCIKILVRHIDLLGYSSNFVIYDTNDAKHLIKDIISNLNLNIKQYQPKSVLYEISKAKNNFLTPDEYEREVQNNYYKKEIAKIYKAYQHSLKSANALDFDDILCLTVKLLKENKEILEKYQNKFLYIMVDEYQDTNRVQYELIKLLSGLHKNLCVVGDDDQSIYKFRGAAIENILNFEKQLENVETIKLEQNYRSTQNILSAANSLISHNNFRKNKKIWTNKGEGKKVREIHVCAENEEAEYVCNVINENVSKNNMNYKDHVVLYRMNAQSANIEKFLVRNSIPYQIIGSTKFYDRKEIKDIISYLTILDNSYDDLRLTRIINEPKRGIGTGTVSKLEKLSQSLNIPIYEILKNAKDYETLNGKLSQLTEFYNLIERIKEITKDKPLSFIFDVLLNEIRYIDYLKEQGPQEEYRIENIKELKTNIMQFEMENKNATLSDFLFEISLYTDINEYNENSDKISLMTLHAAKGLEFPVVFMIGMEEGIFPGNLSMENPQDLEEERRLAYVGITRAKNELFLIASSQRMIFGSIKYSKPSRFLAEISLQFKEIENRITKQLPAEERLSHKPKISVNEYKTLKSEKPLAINFKKDEIVLHSVFGKGIVLSITPLGNDHLIEIDFKEKGKKKVMANYAKLKKV